MVDWADRVRESITLITPSGTEYEAKWRGNPRTLNNKLGIHEFPGIAGAKIQDLKVGAYTYPLTLFFEGENSDIEAEDFMLDFQTQAGSWQIIHPVKGPIFVYKVSAQEMIAPVESGGLQVIETNWIEGLPDSEEESAAQIQAQANFLGEQLNTSASDQFIANAKQDTPGQRQSIITNIGKAITSVNTTLSLVENAAIIDPQITAIATAIENALTEPILDTSLLAGQVQNLIQLFGLGQDNATDSIQMYSDFTDNILTVAPENPTVDDLGGVAVTELVACAALTAAGQTALIGGIETRAQAVVTAQAMADLFAKITQALDELQTLYNTEPIDLAYFSQTGTFADAYLLSQESTKFLITSLFGLPAERRIIVKEDKATAQVCKDEYGSINTEDGDTANLEKLISSNGLCCDEIYIIEAGRELLIYQ